MRNFIYFVFALFLNTQIILAKSTSGLAILFVKDGGLLIIILTIIAIYKITQTLVKSK